jgi:hypothetical protein
VMRPTWHALHVFVAYAFWAATVGVLVLLVLWIGGVVLELVHLGWHGGVL